MIRRRISGTVLILALWSLGLLTVFAIQMGVNVRQKITLVSRLEKRNHLQFIVEGGIQKAIAILNDELDQEEYHYSAESKALRHNNKEQFDKNEMGIGFFEVSYKCFDGPTMDLEKKYGIIDEESKINLNGVAEDVLSSLVEYAVQLDPMDAKKLARAIIDWREYGESEIVGFFSDDYYDNLEYPYPAKNSDFEIIDELLLVKNMNEDIFKKLLPYLTVYGDGRVNINTVSKIVLKALGLDAVLIEKISFVRRGPDGVDSTEDDYVFQNPGTISGELAQLVELKEDELLQIYQLVVDKKLSTYSYFYWIKSTGQLTTSAAKKTIDCIYDTKARKIKYWREG